MQPRHTVLSVILALIPALALTIGVPFANHLNPRAWSRKIGSCADQRDPHLCGGHRARSICVLAVARTTLVGLLLIAYNGMTQFFPGVVLSLSEKTKPHPLGVGLGILVGIATLAYFAATGKAGPWGLNQGFGPNARTRKSGCETRRRGAAA